MDSLNTKVIIKGIRKQDEKILNKIYKEYFPTIKQLVTTNSGSVQDAKDVFQEGIIIVYKKIKADDFELTSSFKSFIYGICRYIWIKQLSKNKEYQEKLNDYVEYTDFENIDDEEYDKHEEYRIYQHHFKRLSEDCQKLLDLFLKKVPLKRIAKTLGISSSKYIKKKKYKCKEQLVRYIKGDPSYKGISNGE